MRLGQIAAFDVAMHTVFHLERAEQIIRCRMAVFEADGTMDVTADPFGAAAAVDPEHVIDVMCAELREPCLRLDVDLADLANLAGVDALFERLHLREVFLLVADDGLDAVRVAQAHHFARLLQRFRHRLFKRNGLDAVPDAKFENI